jgi:hypothetical protein
LRISTASARRLRSCDVLGQLAGAKVEFGLADLAVLRLLRGVERVAAGLQIAFGGVDGGRA